MEEGLFEGSKSRRLWVRKGSGARVGIVLDAELYLDRMGAADRFFKSDPTVTWVFVSHIDAATRHRDFTCDPEYADFIIEILDLYDTGGEHLVAGLSLSGLAAAFIALRHPDRFSSALCQSGSFWWEREWLTAQVSPGKTRFWLSVGDREDGAGDVHAPTGLRQEISQRVGVERMASALTEAGHLVYYHLFEGGHELDPWRAELPAALTWLK